MQTCWLVSSHIDKIKFDYILFKSNTINKRYKNFLSDTKTKILNYEIENAHINLKYFLNNKLFLEEELLKYLSYNVDVGFFNYNENRIGKAYVQHKKKHKRKFDNLLKKRKVKHPNNFFEDINNKWLINLSTTQIPP